MARIDTALARIEQIEDAKWEYPTLEDYRAAAKEAEAEYQAALSDMTIRTTRKHWKEVCAAL